MSTFFGKIIAVPVRLVAELLEVVGIFDTIPLRSACWKLTRGAEDGVVLITMMCRKHGIKHVRELVERILSETRDSQVASTIGILEYVYGRNVEEANRYLKMAKDKDYKNQELLLLLELMLSNYFDEYNSEAIMEKILSRNDLPAHTTMATLIQQAHLFLEDQKWEQAEQITERVLGIQEQPHIRIVKWAIYMKRGKKIEADRNFERARKGLPKGWFNYFIAQGWLFLGDRDRAMECLCQSDYEVISIKNSKLSIDKLAHSEEFENYCRERENG